jgi:hypothetical protein
MPTSVQVASTLFFIAMSASAQTASFDGRWSGQMESSAGFQIRVELAISSSGGSLRLSPSGQAPSGIDNPDLCHNREIPVSVSSRTASDMAFVVRGDQALRGCFKGAGALKLVDAKNLTGTLEDGRSFRLSRR